jgi:hypothetical protein
MKLTAQADALVPQAGHPHGAAGVESNGALTLWFVLGNAKMNILTERSLVNKNPTILFYNNRFNY